MKQKQIQKKSIKIKSLKKNETKEKYRARIEEKLDLGEGVAEGWIILQ